MWGGQAGSARRSPSGQRNIPRGRPPSVRAGPPPETGAKTAGWRRQVQSMRCKQVGCVPLGVQTAIHSRCSGGRCRDVFDVAGAKSGPLQEETVHAGSREQLRSAPLHQPASPQRQVSPASFSETLSISVSISTYLSSTFALSIFARLRSESSSSVSVQKQGEGAGKANVGQKSAATSSNAKFQKRFKEEQCLSRELSRRPAST